MFYGSRSQVDIMLTLHIELEVITQWLRAYHLTLNSGKTKFVIFGTRARLNDLEEYPLYMDGVELERLSVFKYLGVYLDTHLDFEVHSRKIISKVNQRTGPLWRIRSCIGLSLAKDLYCSLIEPIFLYCSHLYDACTVQTKRQLQTCQNNALRAVLRAGQLYSTEQLHTETNIP